MDTESYSGGRQHRGRPGETGFAFCVHSGTVQRAPRSLVDSQSAFPSLSHGWVWAVRVRMGLRDHAMRCTCPLSTRSSQKGVCIPLGPLVQGHLSRQAISFRPICACRPSGKIGGLAGDIGCASAGLLNIVLAAGSGCVGFCNSGVAGSELEQAIIRSRRLGDFLLR